MNKKIIEVKNSQIYAIYVKDLKTLLINSNFKNSCKIIFIK